MAGTKWWNAYDVKFIAREQIRDWHKHLISHQVRVDFLFCDPPPKRNGVEQLGLARKVTNLAAFLADPEKDDRRAPKTDDDSQEQGAPPFFVVAIAWAHWEKLERAQRHALVDHQLCHLWAEPDDAGNVKLSLLAHDLEEFRAVVDRHGTWQPDLTQMYDSMQAKLEFEEAAERRPCPDCGNPAGSSDPCETCQGMAAEALNLLARGRELLNQAPSSASAGTNGTNGTYEGRAADGTVAPREIPIKGALFRGGPLGELRYQRYEGSLHVVVDLDKAVHRLTWEQLDEYYRETSLSGDMAGAPE